MNTINLHAWIRVELVLSNFLNNHGNVHMHIFQLFVELISITKIHLGLISSACIMIMINLACIAIIFCLFPKKTMLVRERTKLSLCPLFWTLLHHYYWLSSVQLLLDFWIQAYNWSCCPHSPLGLDHRAWKYTQWIHKRME